MGKRDLVAGDGTAIRVLLVDDHELMRAGLRVLLEQSRPDVQVVAEAGDGREAVRLAQQLLPDIAVVDLSVPELNGVDATRQIISSSPSTRVIALAVREDAQLLEQALRAGATAFVLKQSSASELSAAIAAVVDRRVYLSPRVTGIVLHGFLRQKHQGSNGAGGGGAAAGRDGARDDGSGEATAATPTGSNGAFTVLSPREREVLQLLAEGKTSKEIGSSLHIGIKTVETHRSQIMTKLEIRSIAGLTKYAVRQGITSL
jgi:DNA-binding NarL/FixJ family response regulator